MLSNLSAQQLNEFLENTTSPTLMHLQLLSQTSAHQEQQMQYSCYVAGIKKHFRTIGLSKIQYTSLEKLIEQSDLKRQDVKGIYVKYTRDQVLGYKLEKLGVAVSQESLNDSPKRYSPAKMLRNSTKSVQSLKKVFTFEMPSEEQWQQIFSRKKQNLPELRPLLEPLGEIIDKYVPLYELKMTSKIEGIDKGLEQAAAEQRKIHQA